VLAAQGRGKIAFAGRSLELFALLFIVLQQLKEASMCIGQITFLFTTALTLLSSAAFAQQAPVTIGGTTAPATTSPPSTGTNPGAPPGGSLPPAPTWATAGRPPEVGGPMISGSKTGLNKVADDGVSTKTVRAVPCSAAARETDGTTTCVGILERGATAKIRR
jgi:hypothetical protein